MINEFIEIFGDKNNQKRMESQLRLTSKLSFMILKRLGEGAEFINTIKQGDRNQTVMSMIDLALPGYKDACEKTFKELAKINQDEMIESAVERGINQKALMSYINDGNKCFKVIEHQEMMSPSWIYLNEFAITTIGENTFVKTYDEVRPQLLKYIGS